LGTADRPETLEEAARRANLDKLPVIATRSSQPHGHVALILEGKMSYSGSWKANVPNSASFLYKNPQASYVGKSLSFAFRAEHRPTVRIFVRDKVDPPNCL
jgi:hypothetical protein